MTGIGPDVDPVTGDEAETFDPDDEGEVRPMTTPVEPDAPEDPTPEPDDD